MAHKSIVRIRRHANIPSITRIAFGLILFVPLQCINSSNSSSAYLRARQLMLRGALEQSQQKAELGYIEFRISNPGLASKFLLLEADAMVKRGLDADAIRILSTHSFGLDPKDAIRLRSVRGEAFTYLQQPLLADQELTNADALCRRRSYPECGDLLRAHGNLAMTLGQMAGAHAFFLRSLSFSRANHDRWLEAAALVSLGCAELQEERFDGAIDWLASGDRIAAQLDAEGLSQLATGNLGWAYFGLGDSEKALRLFLDAEKRATELGDLGDQVRWLKTTAYVYRDYGDLAQATSTLRQALALATQLKSKQDNLDTLEDLSHVSIETNDLAAADGYLASVAPLARASGNGIDISYVSLAQGKLAAARRQDAQAEALFRTVERDPASQVSMRFGAGHELAKLLETEGKPTAASAAYQAALTTFEGARDQLKDDDSKLPFLANATRIYDDYIHFLVAQGRTREALLVADQSRARTLAQGLSDPNAERSGAQKPRQAFHPAALNPQSVARKAGATLLFYWLGERQSYLWAVTPEKTALFPLPPEREIAPLLDRYRKSLLGAADPLQANPSPGRALYTMLVAPAAKLLRPNAPVMILTDGALSQLNFETLIVPGNNASAQKPHYWIEDVTLSSAPSLSMLAAAKPTRAAPNAAHGKLLLLGNPASPGEDYPELPYASTEMQRIATHFAPQDEVLFSRLNATPQAYLASNPRQFAYIHFVSHGVASRTDPLDSAIILSRADAAGSNSNEDQDSFKLYARQVMQHPIDARLVIISACYGSGTRAYVGEGLVGLSWAFLRAGAHGAIGALWEASDNSTPQLMDTLYQGLEDGQTPAEALRQAKLELLHSTGSFRKPFYWAPFQLYTRM